MAFILAFLLINSLGFSNAFLLHFLFGFFAISLKKSITCFNAKKVETN